nr:high affinity cGMP-specific 3',5'-cyclic phosphodiesterase 9A-like isoform X1 [Ciona intestinalis]XP_026689687.1 high affinity cGMP-specific 3',5'-cyclic phosphodiesterase 9A-like isoform X1 [Ciona intestinalis]|eukprot:XP_002126195.3 high affinity cGMP-specific 3',5'-cyclic phosphodiesterase 9A-like isoform X1 [Ciona intestinalis]
MSCPPCYKRNDISKTLPPKSYLAERVAATRMQEKMGSASSMQKSISSVGKKVTATSNKVQGLDVVQKLSMPKANEKWHSWKNALNQPVTGKKRKDCQESANTRETSEVSNEYHNGHKLNIFQDDEKNIRKTIELLKLSTFDAWKYENEELIHHIIAMFKDLHILDELGITVFRLHAWLEAVEKNYRHVLFHNFRHAFCVTQMMYFMVNELNLVKKMTILQIGILLVACICHDLDHPGLSNLYQRKAHTELSVLYNNSSPLEHHHCAIAFQILSDQDLNIFINLSQKQFSEVSHIIIQLILATDMAIHDQLCNKFNSIIKQGFCVNNPEHMMALQKILIKCCDISNEVRPLTCSEQWVDLLFEEFFVQADRERREGLPVASFMNRSQVHKADDQLKFIRGIILPLFRCLGKVFPDVNTKILKSLQESIRYYENMTTASKHENDGTDVSPTDKKETQKEAHKESKAAAKTTVSAVPKIVVSLPNGTM